LITDANGEDGTAAPLFGDTKYHNHAREAGVGEKRPGWRIEVQARPPGSKDSERKPESAAAMIQISHLHLMLRQLAPTTQPDFRYDAAA
jgi:hypothetical protein